MQVFAKGFVTDYPLTIRHKAGHLTEVLYNASIYRNISGGVLGVVAAARDITAQKRAEAETAEERRKDLRRLEELEQFKKLAVGRELKSDRAQKRNRRIAQAAQPGRCGMKVTDSPVGTAPAVAGPIDRRTCARPSIEDNFAEATDRLGVAQIAVLNILEGFNDKKLRLDQAQSALINILRDAEGERIQLESTQRAILNILEDADQLARNLAEARDQAEEANRAKSRFLTGITHELRTPLHGLLGYAELLSLEGGLNPVQSGTRGRP